MNKSSVRDSKEEDEEEDVEEDEEEDISEYKAMEATKRFYVNRDDEIDNLLVLISVT